MCCRSTAARAIAPQLQALKRGVHVVVGTPGRVIDHLDRGSLDLSELRCLVLDEADEMLRMGFIDDVETVLKKAPATRQVALFSATMPSQIRRIAQTYLKDPVEVAIKSDDQHRDQHPPALLDGQRRQQARRADAHPRSRTVRRHARVRAHQARHRRNWPRNSPRADCPPRRSMATSSRSSASG